MAPKTKRRRTDKTSSPDPQKFNTELCGACLLPLVDETEKQLEDGVILISNPQHCEHLFHSNCLQTWATRETSCPQCRARFSRVFTYSIDGHLTKSTKYNQVFLADILTDSSDDEEQDGTSPVEILSEEEDQTLQNGTRRRRRRPPATVTTRRQVPKLSQETETRLARELSRMRETLAQERRRELREQAAICSRIDPEVVKMSIIRSLKRLPYNFEVPETGGLSKPTHEAVSKSEETSNPMSRQTSLVVSTMSIENDRKMAIPLASPQSQRKVDFGSRFANLKSAPKYAKDFLIQGQPH